MNRNEANYGMHSVCRYCEQDIEFHGKTNWLDRGGNRACVPFFKQGEIIKPKTKHARVQS